MKQPLYALILFCLMTTVIRAQDPRRPPPNPTTPKTEQTGGISFGGKTRAETLPNPFVYNAALSVVAQAIPLAVEEKKLVLDETQSQPRNGLFITKPLVFARGIAVSKSELQHVASLPAQETRGWASGRYALEIRMSPVTATSTMVTVNATIEGLAQDVLASRWIKAESKGILENDFLLALRQLIQLE